MKKTRRSPVDVPFPALSNPVIDIPGVALSRPMSLLSKSQQLRPVQCQNCQGRAPGRWNPWGYPKSSTVKSDFPLRTIQVLGCPFNLGKFHIYICILYVYIYMYIYIFNEYRDK